MMFRRAGGDPQVGLPPVRPDFSREDHQQMKRFELSRGGRLAAVLLMGATLAVPATAADSEDTMNGLKIGDITPAFSMLKIGDIMPAFSMVGSDGKTYNLADFKGDKPVVIAWFPKAFTGG